MQGKKLVSVCKNNSAAPFRRKDAALLYLQVWKKLFYIYDRFERPAVHLSKPTFQALEDDATIQKIFLFTFPTSKFL